MFYRSLLWTMGLLMAAMFGLSFTGLAQSKDSPVPALKARITDTTRTLDAATVQTLESRLADLEKRKGAQIAVLMVPTTGGETIEQYAVRAFEQWKLGRDKVDDGVLLVVAKDDRALRIEVGYGLEGAIPDLVAGRIINEQIVPRFREGDFAGGVVAGVDRLIKRVEGEDLPAPHASAQSGDENVDDWELLFLLILAIAANPLIAALAAGFICFFIWQSVLVALAGAAVMFFISLLFNAARKGRGGGGGGRSGGGGASGRW